jgi:hypothetical protein
MSTEEARADSGLDRLDRLLHEHVQLHERLLDLEEQKRDAIVKNELERIETITSAEAEVLNHVRELEDRRAEEVASLCHDLGCDGETNLEGIFAASDEAREVLAPVRGKLKDVLQVLSKRTRHNAELLRQGVEHVQGFFQTLADARRKPGTYQRRGGVREGGQIPLVDHRA